ncbi:cupin [Mesorhizobium tianshanense]|uniref:Quercetin dioxygenase-like cupin family protein n=1 Tax=Mesorhizobium tianshanense TaxID=39844 RepID=A0A562MW77_9HYPH|nr:cupin domain-containing protein [Mesorhizobium tianshanense]TWI24167.1 quercetin dioxygenase-like cupin family protein [Mesorhizobium tianshanense]GLS36267.1 cupin [Mesorhizobium tianshanense]
MKITRIIAAAALIVASALAQQTAQAQFAELERTNLMQHNLSVPRREVIQVRVDFPPGAVAATHIHPGEELVYVIEGVLEYELEGQPQITVKAGEVLFIPYGTPHAVKNVGSGNATELATYIVEKGKPLAVQGK